VSDTPKTISCSSCGAEIFFARTKAGKLVPLSIKSRERRYTAWRTPGDRWMGDLVDTYLTHFADCPNAAMHRKKKAPDGTI